MPVPDQRDPQRTRALLGEWLSARLPDARDVAVSEIRTPSASGFSSETLLFDAEWTEDGRRRREGLVARVAPTTYQLFPEPRFAEQYRVMRALRESTDVPVPPIHWYEADPSLFGAPFFVMGRIAGRVPSDMPPYHQEGWVTEVPAGERDRMWWRSLEVLARIHRLDVDALDLHFVGQPRWGVTGIEQQLGYYGHFLGWACGPDLPVAEAALEWLRANRPLEPGPPCLLWGDARIGNILFVDGEPQAVLDWEMAALGPPEMDLAWFLYMDRHHSEAVGVPRLEGFPGRGETIERYEALLGRPMRDLDWFEVFAAFRFAVIMARLGQVFIDHGVIPPESDFSTENSAMRLLARILETAGSDAAAS